MILDKQKQKILKVIGILSAIISYIFTVSMMTSFATSRFTYILYLISGVIIDGIKLLALIVCIDSIKNYKHSRLVTFAPLFIIFASVSIVASVSFNINNVQRQLYDTEFKPNPIYQAQATKVDTMSDELDKLKAERTDEFNRINTELDSLPTTYITQRNALEQQKQEVSTKYDNKINDKTYFLNEERTKLAELDDTDIKVQTLKDTAIAGFFNTLSTSLGGTIEGFILTFAVMIGIILDIGSIVCTIISELSYTSVAQKNRQHKKALEQVIEEVKDEKSGETIKDIKDKVTDEQISSYDDFIKFTEESNINLHELSQTIQKIDIYRDYYQYNVKRTSFYKYFDRYIHEFDDDSESYQLTIEDLPDVNIIKFDRPD